MRIVLTTVSKKTDAKKLAKLLVKNRFAACVNSIKIDSVYSWKGKIVEEPEFLLIIKTARNYRDVEYFIKQHHPYELPEVIGMRVENGLKHYLDWVTTASR